MDPVLFPLPFLFIFLRFNFFPPVFGVFYPCLVVFYDNRSDIQTLDVAPQILYSFQIPTTNP
eukprot:UN09559